MQVDVRYFPTIRDLGNSVREKVKLLNRGHETYRKGIERKFRDILRNFILKKRVKMRYTGGNS